MYCLAHPSKLAWLCKQHVEALAGVCWFFWPSNWLWKPLSRLPAELLS